MLNLIVELSRYLLIILMLLFTMQSFNVLRKKTTMTENIFCENR